MTLIPKNVRRTRGARDAVGRRPAAGRASASRPAADRQPGGLDDALRTRGLRLTGPRRVVLEVVRGTDTHPTAERVHQLVRRRLPRVSLGTVYRNLRLLVAEGLVNELPGPHARFDGNVSDHHHFTCLACGRIVDVAAPVTEPHSRALCLRVAAKAGLSVSHHRIEFYGRCPECRVTGRGKPARAPGVARGQLQLGRPGYPAVGSSTRRSGRNRQ